MSSSLRKIANHTGLSVSTVSRALRGSNLIKEETRELVEKAALELGYKRSSLVGDIMSHLRRSAQHSYAGNLAYVYVTSMEQTKWTPFHEEQYAGAKKRAGELGFTISAFSHTASDNRHAAFNRMLRSRGIIGLIFTNSQARVDFSRFDWAPFAAVQMDYPITSPVLHTSGIDHHRTIHMALTRLVNRGYGRFGFFIETYKDIRLAYKWSGAFAAFQRTMPTLMCIPELEQRTIERREFISWYLKYRPDVVIGHKAEAIEWLREEGICVPGDAGFFNLNCDESPLACAGLDLEARKQGEIAVESVVTQIHQFERGVPDYPKTISIEGRWVEGPTICPEKLNRGAHATFACLPP
jgi:LacI family transcriptional regulator